MTLGLRRINQSIFVSNPRGWPWRNWRYMKMALVNYIWSKKGQRVCSNARTVTILVGSSLARHPKAALIWPHSFAPVSRRCNVQDFWSGTGFPVPGATFQYSTSASEDIHSQIPRISKHDVPGQISHVDVKASPVAIYESKRLLRARHHQGIRDCFWSDAA